MEAAGSPNRGPTLTAPPEEPAPVSPTPLTPSEALELILDCNFSEDQYDVIRYSTRARNVRIYPKYGAVRKEKVACMPPKETRKLAWGSGQVQLQALLDHTAQRLLKHQSDVLQHLLDSGQHRHPLQLTLLCKWGMDGSTEPSHYQQTGLSHECSPFVVSIVPLQLVTNGGAVVWNNLTPNSPRFCRPVTFQFVQETPELIQAEQSARQAEIANIRPLRTDRVEVSYRLQLTMLDGEAANAIACTASTQNCSMCGATPEIVNNLSAVADRPVCSTEFGISTIHCWTHVFEELLHLAYRLSLKVWNVQAGDKPKVDAEKAAIQQKFRDRLRLRVDEPRDFDDEGFTARRPFKSPAIFSECTGIDKDLIMRLHVLLQAISCGCRLSISAVTKHCRETAERYVHLYPWYPMPPTLHKLLVHTEAVLESYILPIWMMSEEASDARDEQANSHGLHDPWKDSEIQQMSDLFTYLLARSDPLISSSSRCRRRAHGRYNAKRMLPEAIALLVEPQVVADAQSDCDSDSSGGD